MAVEVYPQEKGGEISYLIIILHIVDGYSVDAELGTRNKEELKPPFKPTLTLVSSVSGILLPRSTGHKRSMSPIKAGMANRISPSRFVATPSLETFIALFFFSLLTIRICLSFLPAHNIHHAHRPRDSFPPVPVCRFLRSGIYVSARTFTTSAINIS